MPPTASTTSSSASATRATSSRSGSPTTRCTPPTSRSTCARGEMEVHRSTTEPWRVTLVETGDDTMTGGRLKRVLPYVGDETFCLTYGDGVADVDIRALVAHHREAGPAGDGDRGPAAGRFGSLEIDGAEVAQLRREAARRRRLDQRRLLRLRARRRRCHRRRRHEVGGGAAARPRRARRAERLLTIAASGRRWTRCASATSSRRCGSPATRRGARGRPGRPWRCAGGRPPPCRRPSAASARRRWSDVFVDLGMSPVANDNVPIAQAERDGAVLPALRARLRALLPRPARAV